MLGVPATADQAAIKKAHRSLVRQWHPDVCKEPDAHSVFIRIQRAYEILSDAVKRQKYDCALQWSATQPVERMVQYALGEDPEYWRPPLRCGLVLVEGEWSGKWFVVSAILGWEDITNSRGQILVSSWPAGASEHVERWVDP